jgi:hypothetical protein
MIVKKFLIFLILIGFSFSLFSYVNAEKLFSGEVRTVPSNTYVNYEWGFSITPPPISMEVRTHYDGELFSVHFYNERHDEYDFFVHVINGEPLDTFDIYDMSEQEIAEEYRNHLRNQGYDVKKVNANKFDDGIKRVSIYYEDEIRVQEYSYLLNNGKDIHVGKITDGWIGDVYRDAFVETANSLYVGPVSIAEGGGCLIATATYGSELAPQVQQLRELRDNSLLQTESGSTFMGMFNDVYYYFSPSISDYERENPVFREAVKLFITPMIASLSILNYVGMDSESKVLGYGISLIVLNVMMYVGVPIVGIVGIKKKF